MHNIKVLLVCKDINCPLYYLLSVAHPQHPPAGKARDAPRCIDLGAAFGQTGQLNTPMSGHHLILGELVDHITGEIINDTHDERYRQKIARLLIGRNGYLRSDIKPRQELLVSAGDSKAIIKIDFLIHVANRIGMVIKYAPGSIVTRRRSVLAASRLVSLYQVPIAVATNGEDAEILDGISGKVISQGLGAIPSKSQLIDVVSGAPSNKISVSRTEIESRILYCYEVDGSCPCDEDICKL